MSFSRSAVVLCLLLTSGRIAWGDDDPGKSEKTVPAPRRGWVFLDEKVWLRYADEPPMHMDRARERFLKREYNAAARELHKVGGYLHAAASHAEEDVKKALESSAREIDSLATGVEKGTVKTVDKLEEAFARAEHALALHHHRMAERAAEHNQPVTAGEHLRAAVNHVENAAKWTGHMLEEDSRSVLRGAKELAGKMIAVPGFLLKESSKGMQAVGSEIQRLGKRIEPYHPDPNLEKVP
ncbi:MAG: hypothetical protein U0903_13395 [Planctomycetales bacterium]